MHIGIIGCGKIAKVHAKILKKHVDYLPGKPIRLSFASRNLEKANQYRKRYNGDLAFGNYDEALCHRDIDVILICTPNDSHKDLALKALEYAKDIIIEKPIACNSEDAQQIIQKAKEVGKLVFVAENHRFRPHIRRAERMIQSGELGQLKMIRMNVMRTHQFQEGEWRADSKQMGGGPLIDGGIHWVNALLTLGGGEVRTLTAMQPPTTLSPCPQEDSMAILCQFASGCVGVLTYSWGIEGSFPLKFFSVHGSKGSIYISNSGMIGWQHNKIPHPLFFPIRDWQGYVAMWQDFLVHLGNQQAETSLCTGLIGKRDLEFVEEVYRRATSPTSKPRSKDRRVA